MPCGVIPENCPQPRRAKSIHHLPTWPSLPRSKCRERAAVAVHIPNFQGVSYKNLLEAEGNQARKKIPPKWATSSCNWTVRIDQRSSRYTEKVMIATPQEWKACWTPQRHPKACAAPSAEAGEDPRRKRFSPGESKSGAKSSLQTHGEKEKCQIWLVVKTNGTILG